VKELDRLAPRQRQVVELMAQGHSCESTAQQMDLSAQTVKHIRHVLYMRYGVNGAIDLLLRFYDLVARETTSRISTGA